MQLYLVRHAIAGTPDPDRWPDDSERPLTKRGWRRFSRAARGMQALVPKVETVLSSPYVRAWETAMILHTDAGWPTPERRNALTGGPVSGMIEVLHSYMGTESLALVGHEPGLSELAGFLLSPERPPALEMKKGAVVCLELHGLDPVEARLLWLLPPRVLRGLA
jgi:phosphohistidine phosphatase